MWGQGDLVLFEGAEEHGRVELRHYDAGAPQEKNHVEHSEPVDVGPGYGKRRTGEIPGEEEEQMLLVPVPVLVVSYFRHDDRLMVPGKDRVLHPLPPYRMTISIIVPKFLWVSMTPFGEPVVPLE